MMRNLWPVYLMILLALTACQAPESDDQQQVAAAQDDGFEAFYQRFHQDSLYQIAHIQFPLQGVSSNPTDNHSAFRWELDDWRMHRPFDEAESGFRSELTRLGVDFIIERIVHHQGLYGMERRFSRLGGDEWYLIYYAALHPL